MRKLIFLFVLLLSIGYSVGAQQITFKASAPEAVAMGEQFRLSFVVNGDGKDIRLQELPDFDVLMGPSISTARSSRWENGKSTSEINVTYTYILMPKKEGTFTIPAATVRVNNSNYTSNSLTIRVLPPDSNSGSGSSNPSGAEATTEAVTDDGLFVRMNVSKRSVYEQEGILVTFKLYSLYDMTINNFKFPEFDGFLAQEIDLKDVKWTRENYNGRNYNTAVIKQTVLYPQRSGTLTIDGAKFDAVVRVRVQQRVRSIFDDFFGTVRDVNKQLTTQPVTIEVKPLPSGKPASYASAVGDFEMTASLSSDHVKAGDAVTLNLKIVGSGNIRLIKNPEVVFPNDFEVYDPKIETDYVTNTAGTNGRRVIEYLAIPRYGGDFEIPAVKFSYFDLKSGSYKTLTAGPYKLHVEKGAEGTTSPVVSNFGNNRENINYLNQDIRYLKVKGIHFHSKEEMFFGSFLYWMCYLIPAILFVIFFIVYRKQIKENSDLALVRTKKANKIATKRLKNAGKLLKENKKEEFYEEVLRALWGYLSDKLNIPQANLTKDNVEAELTRYGVDEVLINEFMDILNTCEFARYAPAQTSDAMDKIYATTADAIGKMENTIKK